MYLLVFSDMSALARSNEARKLRINTTAIPCSDSSDAAYYCAIEKFTSYESDT